VNELTLAAWGNIAEIIGAFSIVTGLMVGWIQIRHLRRQQRGRNRSQMTHMEFNMLAHKGSDKKVAVIVACLQAYYRRVARIGARLL
jgi:hypothetical protein